MMPWVTQGTPPEGHERDRAYGLKFKVARVGNDLANYKTNWK
jgi:hypothetical protein